MGIAPWLFAFLTGVWFGLRGRRAGQHWALWALGGAAYALVVSTIVLGLAHARFIPVSHEAYVRFRIESILSAAIFVIVPGWLFTLSLRRKPPVG